MPGIDASIYGNQQIPDSMTGIGKMLDVKSKSLQNRLLQIQTAGKVAAGQALLEATNPDGSVDYNKLTESLKKNPAGFAGAAEALPGGLDIQSKHNTNVTGVQNIGKTSIDNLGAIWGARLATTTGPVKRDDLIGDIIDGMSTGRIDPATGKAAIARAYATPDSDLRAFAAGGFIQSLGPAAASPVPGTPTDAGAPTTTTAGQLVAGATGGTVPTPPAPGSPNAGTGSDGSAATTAPPAAPAAPRAPGVGVTTGLNPGAAAGIQSTGVEGAASFTRLRTMGDSVPDRLGALRNMETAGNQFKGGPVTDELKKLVAGVNQVFGTNYALGSVAAIEEYGKLANQIALAQSSALGISSTDLTTTTAMGANPNTSLSSLGQKRIIGMLKGNEDAIAAKAKAGQDWLKTHTPETYGAFAQDFNAHFDPRVFQSKYWSEEEAAQAIKQMRDDKSIDKFQADYNYAAQKGWIAPPKKG